MKRRGPTLLDRARHALRALRGDWPRAARRGFYTGADSSRLTLDWEPSNAAPDVEVGWSTQKLRARARELERNNPTMRQFLRLLAVNVVGPDGIKLQAQVRNNDGNLNKALNDRIEAAWADFCERPTRDGKQDMAAFVRLAVKTVARDGEAFVRVVRGFTKNRFGIALELVDADLVDETLNRAAGNDGNEIRLGVEVDEDGRPVAYHGWNRPASSIGTFARRERVRYPADEIIHLYDLDRGNQTRGVTWAASVMFPLRMRGAYVEAEVVSSRVSASKMGMYEPQENGGTGELGDREENFETEANPGTFGVIPRGYKLTTFNPDHPSTAFEAFLKGSGREVATGFGVSYNGLFGDLENVNYSSIRSGLLVEREVWRTVQAWLVGHLMRPVYDEWLNWSTLTGSLVLDSRDFRKFRAAKWIPRGWAWVDPLKDVQAAALAIQWGLASRTSVLAEQGPSFEDVLDDLAEEQELADAAGVEVEGPDPTAAGGAVPASADQADGGDSGGDSGSNGKGSKAGRSRLRELLTRPRRGRGGTE